MTLAQANEHVRAFHRHHKPVLNHRFSIGCMDGDRLCGVAILGRPVARNIDQYNVLEVARLCTDGTRNACSIMYAAAARAAEALGFVKIQTYILASEPGTSLRAAGWTDEGPAGGGSWSRDKRGRADDAPIEPKRRWAKVFRQ